MHQKIIFICSFCFVFFLCTYAQQDPTPCNASGQKPETAIPVCASDTTYFEDTLPACKDKFVPVPCPTGEKYQLTNPVWFKFTCYKGGTWKFTLKPYVVQQNYDWQLFDITNHSFNEIFQNQGLMVSGNWSPEIGSTGTRQPVTAGAFGCIRSKERTYSDMPVLKTGHNYLLVVCNAATEQKGFSMFFTGSEAVITDTVKPVITNVTANCTGTTIRMKLNKKITCNSIEPNGSDFEISPKLANVIAATGYRCNYSYDVDSITLTLDKPIPSGSYSLVIKDGTDKNTLVDGCMNAVPENSAYNFIANVPSPPGVGSILPLSCGITSITLYSTQDILCSSIAQDGSDYIITGPSPVKIISVQNECENATTTLITLSLSGRISVSGNYRLQLKKGTDGNTILNECGMEASEGMYIDFATLTEVSANFDYNIHYGCINDTAYFFHDGANGVNNWTWNFSPGVNDYHQNSSKVYYTTGEKTVSLVVSNGACSDTLEKKITLPEKPNASFEAPSVVCPGDSAFFINKSSGDIKLWNWNFGNGMHSNLQNPPPQYYYTVSRTPGYALVQLITTDNVPCADTATAQIKIIPNCHIDVPSAFTPNHDGLNDYLYPLNAYKATDLDFKVYNRLGQLVFHTADWTIKWDGTIKNIPQDTGAYSWVLTYTDTDTGKRIFRKGITTLLR